MNSVFIIDDERNICESIKMILEYENYSVEYSIDPRQALAKLEHSEFDLILLDIQMPGLNGFEILSRLKDKNLATPVIIISAHGNIENAVKATKLGAFDFLEKPIDRDKLLIAVRNALKQKKLLKENRELKENLDIENEIIGESPKIKALLESLPRIAVTDARVLISGENGTGKELVARAIHRLSPRADKPLVEVNCAAIPNELIESELFGHEKGAFTGASQQKIGKFELANGGTLFLDEIGDMSLQAQAKVLRAIEDSKIQRVGGTKTIEVDIRIIAATNKNLPEEIEEGNFREDLYHRLNVIPIQVPPLRERREDIPLLTDYFAQKISRKYNYPQKSFSKDAYEYLSGLPWKGNVRELRNLIERIIILIPDKEITAEKIRPLVSYSSPNEELFDLSNSFQEFKENAEKLFIKKQLDLHGWNISKTAEALGIQRSHLYSKIKKYKIEKES
jgi:DNA-binding NtrC family response regulator